MKVTTTDVIEVPHEDVKRAVLEFVLRNDPVAKINETSVFVLNDDSSITISTTVTCEIVIPPLGTPVVPVPPVLPPITPLPIGSAELSVAAAANAGILSSKNVPGDDNGALGCAWAVSTILNGLGMPFKVTLSTDDLFDQLKAEKWISVYPGTPGSVIISPTEGNKHGHVGIVGIGGLVYSNSSATGIWTQNYTPSSWKKYFTETEGLKTLGFAPPVNSNPPLVPVPIQPTAGHMVQVDPPYSVTGPATEFGYNDPQDNGEGFFYDPETNKPYQTNNTNIRGVSLPREVLLSTFLKIDSWKTDGITDCWSRNASMLRQWVNGNKPKVTLDSGGKSAVDLDIVDAGPKASTKNAIDLTHEISVELNTKGNALATYVVTVGGIPMKIRGWDWDTNQVG